MKNWLGSTIKFITGKKGDGIALALGGGSIRGMVHVGVLKVFEKHQIPISYISGTSAGSIVGAFYAAGVPVDKIQNILFGLDWLGVVQPHLSVTGFFSSGRLQKFMEKHLPVQHFGETNIPLQISTADLITGKEYVFHQDRDSIALAVTASSSMPGFFAPIKYKEMLLVDGCVVNNVPVSLLKKYNPKYTIGVNVVPKVTLPEPPKNVLNIMARVYDIYQLGSFDAYTAGADLILDPIKEHISVFKPSKALYQHMVKMGEAEAERYIHRIKRHV